MNNSPKQPTAPKDGEIIPDDVLDSLSIDSDLGDDENDARHHVIETEDDKKDVVVPVMPLV